MTTGIMISAMAPAHAAPPGMSVEMLCGALEVRWTSDPLDDEPEPVQTVVLRNGVVVEEFTMSHTGWHRYAAADGDMFLIRRDGMRDTPPVPFRAPDGCTGTPLLDVTAENGCSSLALTLTNRGSDPVGNLLLVTADTVPAGEALASVEPGTTQRHFAFPAGTKYLLITGPFSLDAPIWITGTYSPPDACDSSSPTPVPTTPVPTTPVPTTPVSTTPGHDVAGEEPTGDGTAGGDTAGGLPVTGAAAAGVAVGGVILVGAGVVLLVLTRRQVRVINRE